MKNSLIFSASAGKKVFLIFLIIPFFFSCAHGPSAGGSAGTGPGKYKDWNGIDEVEIVQAFKVSSYSKIAVLPVDTSRTPLPDKSDGDYQPITAVLAKADEIFLEGFKDGLKGAGGISSEPVKSADGLGGGVLLIRVKVADMKPGSSALRVFVGYGAGRTLAKVEGEVVDAQNNNVVLRFTHARASSGAGSIGAERLMTNDYRDVSKDVGKMLLKFQ